MVLTPPEFWSGERIERLRALVASGYTEYMLMKHFGKSRSAIKAVKHVNKIYSNKRSGETTLDKQVKEQSKLSISERIQEMLGIAVKDSIKPKYFTDEQLKSWISDGVLGVDRFASDVLGITLQPYQKEIITLILQNRRTVLLMGRRSGKSFTVGLFALWRALCFPDENICLVSASYESSLLLFNIILRFCAVSQELRWSITKDTADLLRFKNSSEITSLSCQSLALRGRKNTIVICDEVSSFENEPMVFAALTPSLATKESGQSSESKLILISTPRARQGELWRAWNSGIWAHYHAPTTINQYVDLKWLETEKDEKPAEIYQMEYEAQWCDAADMLFPTELLSKITQDYSLNNLRDTNCQHFAGLDVGRFNDASVLTIIRKGTDGLFKIANIIIFENCPFPSQEAAIIDYNCHYNFGCVAVEDNGMGGPIAEHLQEAGVSVLKFTSGLKSKELGYSYLLNLMEKNQLVIPNHKRLLAELKNLQVVRTSAGSKIHHITGHDDLPDSLMLALQAAKYGEIGW